MNFHFSSKKIAAAAAAGLIAAACGGSHKEPETPAGEDMSGDKASCKGEEGCQHKGECKAEEGCSGAGDEANGDDAPDPEGSLEDEAEM